MSDDSRITTGVHQATRDVDPRAPVSPIPTDPPGGPAPGLALCLSGGGYRAMLFHVGALWRLNELGYLPKLKRVSSVSGGSITAGVLGLAWKGLGLNGAGVATQFTGAVVAPIRRLAEHTIDVGAILVDPLPFATASGHVAAAYRKHLFSDATLQDLPNDQDGPRFVINACNVQSGALWRFMKPYMRDYRVGEVKSPTVQLATAVAASSAFPPFLSPLELDLAPDTFTPGSGTDLQHEPFTKRVLLTDGGVYDNLGLETCWKRYDTVLISDGGGHLGDEPDPHRDWARHAYRCLELIQSQVGALRKRQAIDGFIKGDRKGAFWGIRTNIAEYGLANALPAPVAETTKLANTETRLKALSEEHQERLINWGYAVCDAAMRRHVDPGLTAPTGFPYGRRI